VRAERRQEPISRAHSLGNFFALLVLKEGRIRMVARVEKHTIRHEDRAILTKAVLRAADKLSVRASVLAPVLGVSEATVSRMKSGDYRLESDTKPFELGVMFVRLFRSLDAITGGDEAVARAWLDNPNSALDGRPVEKIRTVAGFVDVIAYLDARRAQV
jgi:uncharacterized protein (DUF2384 family)